MGTACIPIRLSIEESSAIALKEAADDLATAHGPGKCLAALEANRRLWLILGDVARQRCWVALENRLADVVLSTSARLLGGATDEHVAALIGINREVSAKLAPRNADSARRRALLAWQEHGKPFGLSLESWLIGEIQRKARFPH